MANSSYRQSMLDLNELASKTSVWPISLSFQALGEPREGSEFWYVGMANSSYLPVQAGEWNKCLADLKSLYALGGPREDSGFCLAGMVDLSYSPVEGWPEWTGKRNQGMADPNVFVLVSTKQNFTTRSK